jgi:type IV pilus assembly protein PilE
MSSRRPVPRHAFRTGRPAAGFTLIELMVALVVAGLLASLALPAFFDSMRKSRRSDAFAALTAAQQAQERWRANNASYGADLATLGLAGVSPNGHYQVEVSAADATSYTLVATSRGSQTSDTRCATIALRAAGGNLQYGSACASCQLAAPLTDPARCWSR